MVGGTLSWSIVINALDVLMPLSASLPLRASMPLPFPEPIKLKSHTTFYFKGFEKIFKMRGYTILLVEASRLWHKKNVFSPRYQCINAPTDAPLMS